MVTIVNEGGTEKVADYSIEAVRPGGRIRCGQVKKFPKASRSALELLRRGLNSIRNLP